MFNRRRSADAKSGARASGQVFMEVFLHYFPRQMLSRLPAKHLSSLGLGLVLALFSLLLPAGAQSDAPTAASQWYKLTLLSPGQDALTDDPTPTVRLRVESLCNGRPCPEGDARPTEDLRIRATLDGQDVGGGFEITGDEATLVPEDGLPEGENKLATEVVDSEGHSSGELTSRFVVDTTPPRFELVRPETGTVVREGEATITGREDDPQAEVRLAGIGDLGGAIQSSDPENFSFGVPLEEGDNTFRLVATDKAGNKSEEEIRLVRLTPIDLQITAPDPNATVTESPITVKGRANGPEGLEVYVGDTKAQIEGEVFSAQGIELQRGPNTVVVDATTPDGRSEERNFDLFYDAPQSAVQSENTEPQNAELEHPDGPAPETSTEPTTSQTVDQEPQVQEAASTEEAQAQSSSSTEPNPDVAASGADTPSSGDAEELTAATVPAGEPETGGGTTVRTEEAPNQPALSTSQTLPEDPDDLADTDVVTDFAASTEFIYEGPDAVQTGVQEGAIDAERVSVLRGEVGGPEGDPLPGVRVTVLDHPEYGQTLSREDGAFDLAVNGGGTVTLVYEKEGYLSAQRKVEAPWRDFATAEEVAMVPFSERVTDVDLSGSADMLVAQGETVTDEDGTRRPTTLFPEGVQAEIVMPNGETRPLPDLDFRAVEYTVGEDGPEQMPAALPPASGYTHAVELSVDEAIEAGAETVKFSEPLYYYVENYLEFPVGTDLPTGFYDREEGAWKASNDGRIVKILSIKDGLAELDLHGTGQAADAATLQEFGVTDEERRKLATLYEAGESLWRVPVDHLTPWDCNYPWGSPPGATAPNQPPVMPPGPLAEPECESGSIIECQNQILGEAMDVQGTPFSLRYGSDRVPGRTASNTLEISLSGGTVPTPLKRIELEISVAGQSVKKTYPASPNQNYTFMWDGKDAYGRGLQGTREYLVRVGYIYDAVYMGLSTWARTSSGRPSTS